MKNFLLPVIIFFISIISSNIQAQYLNPGDGVRITFFNISDKISGDYFIQQDGQIQLPYVGLINTIKRPYPSIRTEIVEKFDSLYKKPELTVQPLYKINILGEVKSPGYYVVTDVEKLTGIFALAGGVTTDANLDDVYIIRGDKEIALDAQNLIESGSTLSDIGLQSGDRIYVPKTWWANAGSITIIVSVVTALVTVAIFFFK
jgi:protein involved in polysaccharide export with SLBB domain